MTVNAKKKRNHEIEFLRFVFASMIVLNHSKNLFPDGGRLFLKCSFAVEFFFIVSGYLLMMSVDRANKEGKPSNLGQETITFLKRKISAFYIELAVAYVLGIVFVLFTAAAPLKTVLKRIVLGIPSDLFLLRMGIASPALNSPLWYLSSMLLCMLILYPLLRCWPVGSKTILVPAVSVFAIGYLWGNYHSLLTPTQWIGFTYKGNLRAFAELGIGIILYQINQVFTGLRLRKWFQYFLTAFKWIGYVCLLVWMTLFSVGSVQLVCLGFFAVCILLSFSKQCSDSSLFDNGISLTLGQLSMPLYICHGFLSNHEREVANLVNVMPSSWGYGRMVATHYACCLAFAVVVWRISSYLRAKRIGEKISNLLVDKVEA